MSPWTKLVAKAITDAIAVGVSPLHFDGGIRPKVEWATRPYGGVSQNATLTAAPEDGMVDRA